MMTIIMIDVEAGKEDLFKHLYKNLMELREGVDQDKIQFLYQAKCFTHSDISLLVDIKDPEALPSFITNILLQMDGVWDIQVIPLLNPRFFELPAKMKEGIQSHFTVTLDVRSNKTKTIYNKVVEMAANDDNVITFLAYSFYSYENDIILSLLAPDMRSASEFVTTNFRSMDGVIDTVVWEIDKWKFIISAVDLMKFINSTRKDDQIDEERWEKSYKALMDSYICAI